MEIESSSASGGPESSSSASENLRIITEQMKAKRLAREAAEKETVAPKESTTDKVAASKARVEELAAQTEENLRRAGFIKTVKSEVVDDEKPSPDSPEESE